MNVGILNIEGKEIGKIELPNCFSVEIRKDLIAKSIEVLKTRQFQPYSSFYLAGKQASASGKIRHGRRKWKTAYGRGISRVPRKIMWRRGSHFYWIGATISSARGGRRVHPPRVIEKEKSMNRKETIQAVKSAIAATANPEMLKKRYESLHDVEIKTKLPIIVESKMVGLRARDFLSAIKRILPELFEIAIPKESIRAGKGKLRGRRYKKSAGMLLVTGDNEETRIKRVDVKKAKELNVLDLAYGNPGRLTVYTEKAVKDLAERFEKAKKLKEK